MKADLLHRRKNFERKKDGQPESADRPSLLFCGWLWQIQFLVFVFYLPEQQETFCLICQFWKNADFDLPARFLWQIKIEIFQNDLPL